MANKRNAWFDGYIDVWIDVWIDAWIDAWIDVWDVFMGLKEVVDEW